MMTEVGNYPEHIQKESLYYDIEDSFSENIAKYLAGLLLTLSFVTYFLTSDPSVTGLIIAVVFFSLVLTLVTVLRLRMSPLLDKDASSKFASRSVIAIVFSALFAPALYGLILFFLENPQYRFFVPSRHYGSTFSSAPIGIDLFYVAVILITTAIFYLIGHMIVPVGKPPEEDFTPLPKDVKLSVLPKDLELTDDLKQLRDVVKKRLDSGETLEGIQKSLVDEGYPKASIEKVIGLFDWKKERGVLRASGKLDEYYERAENPSAEREIERNTGFF